MIGNAGNNGFSVQKYKNEKWNLALPINNSPASNFQLY
jgi:hypothetical protein